jgi:hypothetical protein
MCKLTEGDSSLCKQGNLIKDIECLSMAEVAQLSWRTCEHE